MGLAQVCLCVVAGGEAALIYNVFSINASSRFSYPTHAVAGEAEIAQVGFTALVWSQSCTHTVTLEIHILNQLLTLLQIRIPSSSPWNLLQQAFMSLLVSNVNPLPVSSLECL